MAAQRGAARPRAEKRHQDHRGPALHQGPQLQETPGQAEGKVGEDTAHTYPLDFLLYMTWSMTVVCYKVNYLPVGIRIWFWPNCRIRVFGDMANFSSEIG